MEILAAQNVIASGDYAFIERDGFGHAAPGVAAEAVPDILPRVEAEIVAGGGAVPGIGAVDLLPAAHTAKANDRS